MDFGQSRAKPQAVSRRPLTAKARVRSQVHVVFVVDKVKLARFLSQYFGFPLSLLFHQRTVLTCISTQPYEDNGRIRGAPARKAHSLYVSFRNTGLMLGGRAIDANTNEWDATAPASHETVP
jgi:hypothetical protein